MKFVMFIHNDDTKCFHMVVQRTNKLVVMGHINFKVHASIKRCQADEKMNVTGGMFKDEKNGLTIEAIYICCCKLCAFLKF
jgi:hypothetical protein